MVQAREQMPMHAAARTAVPLRAPETVMRLARMGSFHQTRLSFMRVLLRRLARENWTFARPVWSVDAKGEGHSIYEARGNGRVYSLIAFANDLDPSKRTDRVIAQEWDSTFVLYDGVPTQADIERLSRNVPRQEAGRCSASEIVLARANKSVRLFELVADKLAAGHQPDAAELDAVGYLMRTTAVYGSGKFGLVDHEAIRERPEFSGPFAAEMLAVWLIRAYTIDLVEHMARMRALQTAVPLDRALRRRLGVGNSTGLGMAPFLVTHAALIDRWITARETALARVRSVSGASSDEIAIFRDMLARGRRQMDEWNVDDVFQMARIEGLRRDLATLAAHVDGSDLSAEFALDRLYRFAENKLGLEAQEFLVTLLVEPYGHLVDDLADTMACDEARQWHIDGSATLAALAEAIDAAYGHALGIDFGDPKANARFWYVSEEKLEPRLGERASDDGAELEQPLAVARDVKALRETVRGCRPDMPVAVFLLAQPEFRHVVRRVQIASQRPYAEVRDNLIDASMRPIDLLRCKLSFFGASGFDPRSDRWVRIALYRHAPFPDELHELDADDWAIPPNVPKSAPPARTTITISGKCDPHLRLPSGDRLSLNELDALVRKASRGSGLSWGLAEEAGKAARALGAAEPTMLEALAEILEAQHSGKLSTSIDADGSGWSVGVDRPLNPLVLGAAISDQAFALSDAAMRVAGEVARPSLLLPFLVTACRLSKRSLLIRTDRAVTSCSADGWAADATRLLGDGVRLLEIEAAESAAEAPRAPAATGAVSISEALRKRFERLAHLTYVPSSERSRATGAGAGLNDND